MQLCQPTATSPIVYERIVMTRGRLERNFKESNGVEHLDFSSVTALVESVQQHNSQQARQQGTAAAEHSSQQFELFCFPNVCFAIRG